MEARRRHVPAVFNGGLLETTTMAQLRGTIKRLISDKGFGFVAAEDGMEYFFHQASCVDGSFDQMREGQALTFDKGQGPKGPRAENVRLA
jgi:CspA family cold shock protein